MTSCIHTRLVPVVRVIEGLPVQTDDRQCLDCWRRGTWKCNVGKDGAIWIRTWKEMT